MRKNIHWCYLKLGSIHASIGFPLILLSVVMCHIIQHTWAVSRYSVFVVELIFIIYYGLVKILCPSRILVILNAYL